MPDGTLKEKTKCNGINQNNIKFINPMNGHEDTKLNYDIFEELYLNSRENVDINTLFKHDRTFIMPDRLSKINYKRTNKQKQDKIPMFSIHSTVLERSLFNEQWKERATFNFPYTVPKYSCYYYARKYFDIWYFKTKKNKNVK